MKWDGEKFVDANEVHRYADPGFWGPVAVTAATMGAGLLPNAAAQAPTTASTLAGPGASALAPGATSAAVPGATSAALNTSPYYLGALGPAATSGLTAAQIAAAAAPTALSVGPYVSNLFRPDAPSTAQPSSSGPGSDTGSDTINSPGYPGTPSNSTTNSPGLPFGLRANDLAGYGLNFLNNFLNRNAANDQGEARAAADKAALDFAIRAYDEQKALEQARWDANETRRVPYRRASLDTLAEFRKLLGLGD
jgi:hypothetical protein